VCVFVAESIKAEVVRLLSSELADLTPKIVREKVKERLGLNENKKIKGKTFKKVVKKFLNEALKVCGTNARTQTHILRHTRGAIGAHARSTYTHHTHTHMHTHAYTRTCTHTRLKLHQEISLLVVNIAQRFVFVYLLKI
jgi:hypothetical protein